MSKSFYILEHCIIDALGRTKRSSYAGIGKSLEDVKLKIEDFKKKYPGDLFKAYKYTHPWDIGQ